MAIKYVLTYVAGLPDNEDLIVEPLIGHELRLFHPAHQITMTPMIYASTVSDDIENLFCTPFVRCFTSALVHLKFLTTKATYHAKLPGKYL